MARAFAAVCSAYAPCRPKHGCETASDAFGPLNFQHLNVERLTSVTVKRPKAEAWQAAFVAESAANRLHTSRATQTLKKRRIRKFRFCRCIELHICLMIKDKEKSSHRQAQKPKATNRPNVYTRANLGMQNKNSRVLFIIAVFGCCGR